MILSFEDGARCDLLWKERQNSNSKRVALCCGGSFLCIHYLSDTRKSWGPNLISRNKSLKAIRLPDDGHPETPLKMPGPGPRLKI